jgi:hypothetical protein
MTRPSGIERLIAGDYMLSEVRISGQQRLAVCSEAELLRFWERILQTGHYGTAPGGPGPATPEGRESLSYWIEFRGNGLRPIRTVVSFLTDDEQDHLDLMWETSLLGDPDYYWFQIPEPRPASFVALQEFLFDRSVLQTEYRVGDPVPSLEF